VGRRIEVLSWKRVAAMLQRAFMPISPTRVIKRTQTKGNSLANQGGSFISEGAFLSRVSKEGEKKRESEG